MPHVKKAHSLKTQRTTYAYSNDLIIREEDSSTLETLMDDLFNTLHPIGKVEEVLTEKIGSTLWRLQRLISAESRALEEKDWMGELRKLQEAYNTSILGSITRYESSLERNLYRALHELQRLQGMRQGQSVIAPSQQKPYVNHRINGRSVDKFGKFVSSNKSKEAHIPLEEFVYRNNGSL